MSRRATLRIAVLAAAAAVAAGCVPGGSPEVPDEVAGVWTTDDPRYADRALHITADSVRFDTGGGGHTIHAIRGLASEHGEGGRTRYDLRYEVQGGASVLSFQHGGGTLVLEGRPGMTWRRERPAAAPRGER